MEATGHPNAPDSIPRLKLPYTHEYEVGWVPERAIYFCTVNLE